MLKNKRSVNRITAIALMAAIMLAFSFGLSYGSISYAKDYNGIGDNILLCPGGMAFGVQMKTDGVIVIGFSKISTENGEECPAEKYGITVKDLIMSVNGKKVLKSSDITDSIERSDGNEVIFGIRRENRDIEIKVKPEKCVSDGIYRIGIWLRDSTAGIGTVTFIDPESGIFAGLGHGICDSDTGIIMPLSEGKVHRVTVSSVRKGKPGAPGEIKGWFHTGVSGSVFSNTGSGVFGKLDEKWQGVSAPLECAEDGEIKEGYAEILCTLEGDAIGRYSIKIISLDRSSKTKNFTIELSDERLLSISGGIVQGMSGSPIIQNGKIIGAVTHVTVNDPSRGYGISISNMLKAMPQNVLIGK